MTQKNGHFDGSGSDDFEELEALLNARNSAPTPQLSSALRAQLLQDALHHLPAPGGLNPRKPALGLALLWQELGAWRGVGGAVFATSLGVVIGLGGIAERGMETLVGTELVWNSASEDGLTAFGWDMDDG